MSIGLMSLLNARTTQLGCVLILALALLAGCGPGTGGTGTGETSSPLDYFGATPANICDSSAASALKCPPPPPSDANPANDINLPTGPKDGTEGIYFSTFVDGKDINLLITGNRATLRDRCLRLVFEGDWAIAPVNDARFFGTYTIGNDKTPQLGSMTMEGKRTDVSRLNVVIRDATGSAILGPVLLTATLIPSSNPAACPP